MKVFRATRTLLCFLAAASLHAAPPLRDGWSYITNGQNLIQSGLWACVGGVTITGNSLTIPASSNYVTATNATGPVLQANGDFSVLTTLSAPAGSSVFLTLVGTLSTGPNFWNGLHRLDVGFSNNNLSWSYWTGDSASSTGKSVALPASFAGTLDLEVARVGSQIVIFSSGTQVSTFPDPGLFASGTVYFGFNVAPSSTLTVQSLSAAQPAAGKNVIAAANAAAVTRDPASLRDTAAPSGLLIGAAVDPSHFATTGYLQTLGREFSLIVPENAMKFAETEPGPHQFSFCSADQIIQFAQANTMSVRGHNLVWHEDLPGWLTSGNYSSADAAAILQEHINTFMTRYKGQLTDVDVVNEATHAAPYTSTPSYWYSQLGSNYVDLAFQWAHAADPNAKLFYNDYDGEGLGASSDLIYNLVSGLVSRGIPINGVGIQMHVTTTPPSVADIKANMARYAALGLEVHVTEMDVRIPVDSSGKASAADLAKQAAVYQNVYIACQASPNCTAFLTWGVSDLYSWIPGFFSGFGDALLFDANFAAKPAVASIKAQMKSTAVPVIFADGIVIHGGVATVVSPGSLVDIYGSALADSAQLISATPLPASLNNVQVTVNGKTAPLYYVSPGLVIFQIPYETKPGPVIVQVTNANGSSLANSITVEQVNPSILTYGANWGVVQNQDYSINSASNCAAAGEYLIAYLMGSGPLDNAIPTAAAAPLSPLSRETLTTTATVGGVNAPVVFAGMTPLTVGLMQVNVQAPAVPGTQPLQIAVGSRLSNQASVCIK